MIPWDDNTERIDWEVPLNGGEPPEDVPAPWVDALRAVGHDLRFLSVGAAVPVDQLAWRLQVNSDFWVAIGLRNLSREDTAVSEFLVGRGFAFDAPTGQCTVWVAATVQDELAGYSHIQWPSRGGALFEARLIGDTAVWTDRENGIDIPIGTLGA